MVVQVISCACCMRVYVHMCPVVAVLNVGTCACLGTDKPAQLLIGETVRLLRGFCYSISPLLC